MTAYRPYPLGNRIPNELLGHTVAVRCDIVEIIHPALFIVKHNFSFHIIYEQLFIKDLTTVARPSKSLYYLLLFLV